ncbi:MAG TPA: amidohydrolase [Roseiarcus sp.]|jgi:aminobenzoyl-glutamate utilization protein A
MPKTAASVAHPLPVADGAVLQRLVASARRLQPALVADRRYLHAHPELGWEENETTAFVARRLTEIGYAVRVGSDFLGDAPRLGQSALSPAETGCVAEMNGALPGPTVVIRIDLDALPITEAADGRPAVEGWASQRKGIMHACGHDGHVAIGLGVAQLLAERAGEFAGRLRLLFQPAEEGARGARSVVEAGWLDDADVLLGFHIGLGVPTGSLALGVQGFLASKKFRLRLTGRPAHAGNAPEQGRNALIGACQIVLALQSLAQSSRPNVRVNVGVMNAGRALNVVPENAELAFELRAGARHDLDALVERANEVVEGIARGHGLQHAIELIGEAADWANPPEMAGWAHEVAQRADLFANHLMQHEFGASEDATLMLRAVADRGGLGGYFVLGSDLASGHHTANFDFDEDVLSSGAAFVGALALSALRSPNLRREASA